MTVASLAMYPFTHLRPAFDQLWEQVSARLPFATPALDWDLDHLVACRRDDLLLGQTCGWPLITELATTVHVVGTFDFDVDVAVDATYRSVLVTATGGSLEDILHRADLVVAANSPDSLSGWISLQSTAVAHGVRLNTITWTGAHARSIEEVQQGRAHLAAIDAVTWAHIGGLGLTVVGHGPQVPCLPLVSSRSSTVALVGELRRALAEAVHDPALADVRRTLKIRGFVARDLHDYEGLSELVQLT